MDESFAPARPHLSYGGARTTPTDARANNPSVVGVLAFLAAMAAVFLSSCTVPGGNSVPSRHREHQDGSDPLTIEIIPEHLSAEVVSDYLHTTVDGDVRCWVYMSDGLRSVGSKEVWLAVEQQAGEADTQPPPDPLLLFRQLYRNAEKGEPAEIGYVILFGDTHPGFFGRKELRGVMFVPLEPSAQRILPYPTMGAVLLTENEANAALDFGVLRLMGTLGLQHRSFPTAMWNDRERAEMPLTTSKPSNSFLAKVARFGYPGVLIEARARGTRIQPAPSPQRAGDLVVTAIDNEALVVSLPRAAEEPLRGYLAPLDPTVPFALVGDPDPSAVASFAWEPEHMQVNVIGFQGHDGSRISAVFAVFAPGQSAPTKIHHVEDGFAVLLSPDDWTTVRDALASGRNATLSGNGGTRSVQIVWR
jgi:hypothetical protein